MSLLVAPLLLRCQVFGFLLLQRIFRGLDLYNNGKLILNRLKSLPANRQNNDCVEDLMGFALNINLSGSSPPADTYTGTLRIRAQATP